MLRYLNDGKTTKVKYNSITMNLFNFFNLIKEYFYTSELNFPLSKKKSFTSVVTNTLSLKMRQLFGQK